MNDNQDPGLESIWGPVQSEIATARRRKHHERVGGGIAGVTGLALMTAVVLHQVSAPSPEPASPIPPSCRPAVTICDCQRWQIGDVAPAVGIATHYPLIEDKKVFAARGTEESRRIVCLDKRDGQLTWESTLRFSDCRLAADTRHLYALVRSVDGPWCCVAFDAETGRKLWHQPEGPFPLVPPSTLTVHTDGICWTQGNRTISRSKTTGEKMWERRVADDDILSAPASHANRVLVASHNRFMALDTRDGSILYSHQLTRKTTGSVFAGPILSMYNGSAFVASRRMTGKGTLWCMEPTTGRTQWKRSAQSPRALLVSGGLVFLRSSELTVLDAQTGKTLWHTPIGGCGALSVREGRLYLADAEDRSRMLVLDGATGRKLEAQPIAGSCNGIVVSGCMGFLSSNDGSLYAFPIGNRS